MFIQFDCVFPPAYIPDPWIVDLQYVHTDVWKQHVLFERCILKIYFLSNLL